MTTLKLINYICNNPHYEIIAINIHDDMKPMEAIEFLSSDVFDCEWRINGSLENGVLNCYSYNEK